MAQQLSSKCLRCTTLKTCHSLLFPADLQFLLGTFARCTCVLLDPAEAKEQFQAFKQAVHREPELKGRLMASLGGLLAGLPSYGEGMPALQLSASTLYAATTLALPALGRHSAWEHSP
jgi:hypothetical protein